MIALPRRGPDRVLLFGEPFFQQELLDSPALLHNRQAFLEAMAGLGQLLGDFCSGLAIVRFSFAIGQHQARLPAAIFAMSNGAFTFATSRHTLSSQDLACFSPGVVCARITLVR